MPVFKIHHITRYQYDRPVKESVSTLRIFPVSDALQTIQQFDLSITGQPWVEEFLDYYGNRVGDFTMLAPHNQIVIESRVTVSTKEISDPGNVPVVSLQQIADAIVNDIMLLRLAEPERISEQWVIDHMLKELLPAEENLSVSEMVWRCCQFIYLHFSYEKGITTVETTIDEILDHRSGVCQDFAHVMLQMLRTLGIPARYVSGYICPNKSGLRGEGATHAWVEFYQPGHGWIGLDPTNNVWVNGYHVKLATGRDFRDCTPVKGTFKGIAQQSLSVYVSVGYEDGHVFEEVNQVKLDTIESEAMEPWQTDWMQAQQQQQ